MDQCNRTESPEINPRNYGQLILDKGGNNIKWEKTVCFASGAGEVRQLHVNQWRTCLHTMHKNKLKMAKRLKYKTRHHKARRDHKENIL